MRREQGEDDDVADDRPVICEPFRIATVVLQLDVTISRPPFYQLLQVFIQTTPYHRTPTFTALHHHGLPTNPNTLFRS